MATNALLLSLLVLAIANVHSLKVNDTLIRIMFTGTNHIMMKMLMEVEEGRKSQPVPRHSLNAFHSFMERHNKSYSNRCQKVITTVIMTMVREEYKQRYRTFRKNMQRVKLLQETEQV